MNLNCTWGDTIMKHRMLAVAIAGLALPVCALANSALDGTWKFDTSSPVVNKPEVFVLKAGSFRCDSCRPKINVKADGTDQAVAGSPYYDTVSITAVDANTVNEVRKKAGKPVLTVSYVVAADGKTMTEDSSDSTVSTEPITGKADLKRVAKGPVGGEALSGSWLLTKVESASDNGALITYKTDGNMLSMTSPTGQSFSAKLDGSEAPYNGDPGQSTVAVKKVSKMIYIETDKRGSKIISVETYTISADGKSATVKWTDKLHGNSGHYVMVRQ